MTVRKPISTSGTMNDSSVLTSTNTPTSLRGSVYSEVIAKERRGDYLGQTVQLIPHITDDQIKRRIYQIGKDNEAEIVITEIGGTIGDFEMPPFVEAIRQMAVEVGRQNTDVPPCVPHLHAYLTAKARANRRNTASARLQELGRSTGSVAVPDQPAAGGSVSPENRAPLRDQ